MSFTLKYVQRLFSMFPAGLAGVALLILRLCACTALVLSVCTVGSFATHTPMVFLLLTLAFMLLIGSLTPVVCGLALVVEATMFRAGCAFAIANALIHIALTASLLMLGPGAYSTDARRFGRRLILPPRQ